MSVEELRAVLTYVGALGIGGVVGGTVVFLLLKSFLPSYLSEKGKNLATREDIARITDEIEKVRVQYTALVEEFKARHQLRLAAVDRRLQAHQEAFTLWRRLRSSIHTENVDSVVLECQDWWNKNCLYLSAEAREAFLDAYFAAGNHAALVQSRDRVAVNENFAKITGAGTTILAAVELPALGEREQRVLPSNESDTATPR